MLQCGPVASASHGTSDQVTHRDRASHSSTGAPHWGSLALQVWSAKGQLGHVLWLLVLGALWGTSYLFIKVTVSEVPALTLVAGRLIVAAAIMWILLLLRGQTVPRSRRIWTAFGVMGLLSGAIPYWLISWGEQYISSGLASLLQATMPIFTILLAHWLSNDERLTWLKGIGVIAGFAGVGVLMMPDLRQGLQANLLGQMAIIGSSVCYATATLFARVHLRGQSPVVATMGQLTTGALLTVPACLVLEPPVHLRVSWAALACWLALAILGTVIAYIIYYALIERTSATFVSMVTYIIPVNGLILGAVVLGEPLSATVVAGLALILLGIGLVRA